MASALSTSSITGFHLIKNTQQPDRPKPFESGMLITLWSMHVTPVIIIGSWCVTGEHGLAQLLHS